MLSQNDTRFILSINVRGLHTPRPDSPGVRQARVQASEVEGKRMGYCCQRRESMVVVVVGIE